MDNNVKGDEKSYFSETGNWNVADKFSKIKIMEPLMMCDKYEDIALYGYDNFMDELANIEVQPDELRIEGLRHLINELIKITKNVKFAMKKGDTAQEMQDIKERLYVLRDNYLIKTYRRQTDQSAQSRYLKIKPAIFDFIFEKVSEIKSEINFPLNKNNLIFTDKDDFNPKEFKERLKKKTIKKG